MKNLNPADNNDGLLPLPEVALLPGSVSAIKTAAKQFPITLEWQQPWFVGDCILAGPPSSQPSGALTGPWVQFREDGTGLFRCRGRSTDDDDTWSIRLNVINSGEGNIFAVGWTFDLPDPGNWYPFEPTFVFPAALFSAIYSIKPWGSC